MEEIVRILNSGGQSLTGVLHLPDGGSNGVGIIILSPGLKDRSGPHRLYIKIARKICLEGYSVLRFDPHGVGDSDGEFQKGLSVYSFVKIEKGEFVDDTNVVTEWFQKRTLAKKIILAGLCGGAITAMLVACNNTKIHGIISMDTTVILDAVDQVESANPLETAILARSYLKKAINIKKLARFVSFKTNYIELFATLFNYFKRSVVSAFFRTNNNVKSKHVADGRPLNMLYVNSFLSYVDSGRKVLFLVSDHDKSAWEFKHKFQDVYCQSQNVKGCCTILTVDTANHEFASLKAQGILLDAISSWLTKQSQDL